MKHKFEIRKCTAKDIRSLKGKLREDDCLEIKRRWGENPHQVLIHSYRESIKAYVGLIDGEIASVWGVAEQCLLSDNYAIWLFSTPIIEKAPARVAILTMKKLKELLKTYTYLENIVDAEYELCINWLKWLGFTIEKPKAIGVNGAKFRHFYIKQNEVK